jgi:hypothetical protein
MPDGIVRDPRQNNIGSDAKEKRYGILYSPQGGYLAYDKEDNETDLRPLTAGTEFSFAHVTRLPDEDHILWDGRIITHKVTFDSGLPIYKKEGKVVKELNKKAKNVLPKTPEWKNP